MANCGKDILLAREGTEQNQRFIDALNPDSVKLNDFELKDWMKFAYDFAADVNYFAIENDKVPVGNWQSFFKSEAEIGSFLNEVEKGQNITPHLALFVAFIKLLEISKRRFNRLSKRHLDFYYRQILKIKKQDSTPDKVHAIFELARNAVAEKVAKETELDAGKDADGKKLIYKTTDELVANQTKVVQLKSVYNDHEHAKLKAATVANSYDGKGGDFQDDEVKWWPFGYYEPKGMPDTREYDELADAKLGFAVSGEILELQEGERNIVFSLTFKNKLSKSISFNDLKDNLEMYCTGEKAWLGPFNVVNELSNLKNVSISSGSLSDKMTLNIVFKVPKDEGAIVKYDSEIHAESFNADLPVCRILFKTKETTAHDLYRELIDKQISVLKIDVNVQGVNNLNLYNDIGSIKPDKPFWPFGTQPVKKSKFYVDYAECYKKKWTDLAVNIEWKNTPSSFSNWYYAYRNTFGSTISALQFLEDIYYKDIIENTASQNQVLKLLQEKPEGEFDTPSKPSALQVGDAANLSVMPEWKMIEQPQNLIVNNDSYFKAKVEINEKEEWTDLSGQNAEVLFIKGDNDLFIKNLTVANPNSDIENVGPIRLSLNQTFLHEMYPRLYALAMSSEEKQAIIPNEPYTPFIEELTFDYDASAEINLAEYSKKDFDLYHEHPFGQSEECIDLKKENGLLTAIEAAKLNLLPLYCEGGELYIGLENVKNQQTVSLLVQVLEGSENTEVESFEGKQKVEWWMLCSNEWKELNSTAIISDDTGNFLKSGILKFVIPKEASTDNTLLPTGYMWLKARIHKKYNAVSKTIGIHAQAVVAEFANNGNNLQHLNDGLPAETISKMVTRISKVKGLAQPYSSFGGKPEESNDVYYRRISERLRHKNRAITVWDYEHLVLQNFPEIHKVKCLSHTCSKIANAKRKTSYLVPGSTALVVIPDIVNKNVFDIFQPRVSKATLNKIQEFINKLNSPLVQAKVINPEYEELKIELKVQFHKGFDAIFYKSVLREDLTRLLSPWAFDNTAAIQFGLSLHKSVIINYVEKLEYVDFVSDVKLFQKMTGSTAEKEVSIAIPSSPEAILVSSKNHKVDDAINNCVNNNIQAPETCQK